MKPAFLISDYYKLNERISVKRRVSTTYKYNWIDLQRGW